MFLVQRQSKVRLMSFRSNPWVEDNGVIHLFTGEFTTEFFDEKCQNEVTMLHDIHLLI